MKKALAFLFFILLAGCSFKDKYDVARYHDLPEQEKLLTRIITYVYAAPPSTTMAERFKPEHAKYYSFLTPRFSIEKYFVADDGTHYFYVIRPAPNLKDQRGVGGHFKMQDDFQFTGFREVYVTPILPEADLKGRCAFLFDEMVKGNIDKYLPMETYVQWPNPVSYYDTITYEWKLKPGL